MSTSPPNSPGERAFLDKAKALYQDDNSRRKGEFANEIMDAILHDWPVEAEPLIDVVAATEERLEIFREFRQSWGAEITPTTALALCILLPIGELRKCLDVERSSRGSCAAIFGAVAIQAIDMCM